MVNNYENHVNFQDIEHQVGENTLHHFLHYIVWQFLLQTKHLYSTKSSLKFASSRKQSQYLYLIPHVSHFLLSSTNLYLTL